VHKLVLRCLSLLVRTAHIILLMSVHNCATLYSAERCW